MEELGEEWQSGFRAPLSQADGPPQALGLRLRRRENGERRRCRRFRYTMLTGG